MAVTGHVVSWDDEGGWGVLRSQDLPEDCWASFSHIRMEGYRVLVPGQAVRFDWEAFEQDGHAYRAVEVTPLT